MPNTRRWRTYRIPYYEEEPGMYAMKYLSDVFISGMRPDNRFPSYPNVTFVAALALSQEGYDFLEAQPDVEFLTEEYPEA